MGERCGRGRGRRAVHEYSYPPRGVAVTGISSPPSPVIWGPLETMPPLQVSGRRSNTEKRKKLEREREGGRAKEIGHTTHGIFSHEFQHHGSWLSVAESSYPSYLTAFSYALA